MTPEVKPQRIGPERFLREPQTSEFQKMLVIPGYGEFPKKELYTTDDFAALIGRDNLYAGHTISNIKRRNPRIKGTREPGKGKTSALNYSPEEFFLLAQYFANMSKKIRVENPDQHSSTKKQWYTLPEGAEILVTPKQLEALDFVIKAGEKGISRNTLAQGDIRKEMGRDTALASVGNAIQQVDQILSKTPGAGRIVSKIVEDGSVKKALHDVIDTYKSPVPINSDDSSKNPQKQLESKTRPLKTRNAELNFKNPEQIIGTYSVFHALLNLAHGTLDKVPKDIKEHLNNTLKTTLEKKIIKSNLITTLSNVFISTSKEHLERFFKVNFLAYLDLWELKAEEAVTKGDKAFAQIFETLKTQQYTKEQVIKEVLVDHFGLKIPDPTSSPALGCPKDLARS